MNDIWPLRTSFPSATLNSCETKESLFISFKLKSESKVKAKTGITVASANMLLRWVFSIVLIFRFVCLNTKNSPFSDCFLLLRFLLPSNVYLIGFQINCVYIEKIGKAIFCCSFVHCVILVTLLFMRLLFMLPYIWFHSHDLLFSFLLLPFRWVLSFQSFGIHTVCYTFVWLFSFFVSFQRFVCRWQIRILKVEPIYTVELMFTLFESLCLSPSFSRTTHTVTLSHSLPFSISPSHFHSHTRRSPSLTHLLPRFHNCSFSFTPLSVVCSICSTRCARLNLSFFDIELWCYIKFLVEACTFYTESICIPNLFVGKMFITNVKALADTAKWQKCCHIVCVIVMSPQKWMSVLCIYV